MRYRTVRWTVPIVDDPDDEVREWARRQLEYEELLAALNAAREQAHPVETPPRNAA